MTKMAVYIRQASELYHIKIPLTIFVGLSVSITYILTIRAKDNKMNSQRVWNASKNNNTEGTAQSLSVTLDNRVDFYALGAYWIRCTLCVVIFRCIHCMQTVHLIIFLPYSIALHCCTALATQWLYLNLPMKLNSFCNLTWSAESYVGL